MVFLVGIVAFIILMLMWIVGIYNRLVTLRNRIEDAWAQIDVQLRRRFDLIPNLVETVKGYATHEREVFERVTQARSSAASAVTVAEKGQAQNQITSALKSLFAVAEAYPELKANENFMMLQEELSGTESKIAYARQFYNDTVMSYNTIIQSFPSNMIAGPFGFVEKSYFKTDTPEQREPVKVQF